MKGDEFTCGMCKGSFTKARSEDEANAEAKELFGIERASENAEAAVVCDDCFRILTGGVN